MTCKVFIDESGEAGIAKIRSEGMPGSSPYFVLAAAVMPDSVRSHALSQLKKVCKTIPKRWSHATDLSHAQTVFWARSASDVNLRFFAVISNKDTLGEYADLIKNDPDKFYNKCAVYLLEKVGKYLSMKGLGSETPEVIFEERNHDYDALRRYIGKIKDNPIHSDAKYLSIFNPFAITAKSKDEEPLLKYADLVAHAAYQCTNKTRSNFNIPEPRYLVELSKRFGVNEKGRIVETGLKCIHSLEQLELDKDVEKTINGLEALPMTPI